MLLDFEYCNNSRKMIVSEIDEKGDIKFNYYPWKYPKKYELCTDDDPDKHTKYTSWDRKPVKVVDTLKPNRFAIYEFLDRLPKEELERLHTYREPNIYFIDIETEILDTGFVEPSEATSKIQTIAIVKDRNVWVLGLKPLSESSAVNIRHRINSHFEKFGIDVSFQYKSFHKFVKPEHEMISFFFNNMIPKMSVLSGWNFLNYDWQFLVNRCKLLGLNPNIASYTGKLEKIFGTSYEVPAHRLVLDYMELYKKWDTSIKVKESASLNWVGEKILEMEHAAKVSYNGSLQDLYNEDFEKYVFYNAVDTVLVQLIHEKRQYINIAYSIANLAHIRLCDFAYKNLNTTLVQTEGFLRERFREKLNIVFCKDEVPNDVMSIAGGWVKPPNQGINEWLGIFDFASLYPSVIMQFNIAPETFKGFRMKSNPMYASYEGMINKIDEDDIICNNGAVFKREKAETVKYLEDLYKNRKSYKNKMLDQYREIDVLKHDISLLEKELADIGG